MSNEEQRRARILQVAYACSPWKGSEPGVGWNRAVEAAKYSDVWVVCEGNEFRQQVFDYLDQEGDVEGLNFVFVPKTRFEQCLSRIPGLYYVAYNRWHARVFRAAKQLHEEIEFDLAHQVNLCGYREPGYLSQLGIPFVWGPVGGTQSFPWRFLPVAGWRGGLQEALRNITNSIQLRISRRVKTSARQAALLLAANTTIQRHIEHVIGRKADVMFENGIRHVASTHRTRDTGQPLRLLWAGEFRGFKALPILLEAMSYLPPDFDVKLQVLGDGPERLRWRRLAEKLGVNHRIEWLGWVSHREAIEHNKATDVFVFNSLRETGGTVVLEAMSNGVPVIVPDHQGVADMVTPRCGIKIPVTTRGEMVQAYRGAIMNLAANSRLYSSLSAGALERASEYAWPRFGERVRDYYRHVLGDAFSWDARATATEDESSEQPLLEGTA